MRTYVLSIDGEEHGCPNIKRMWVEFTGDYVEHEMREAEE